MTSTIDNYHLEQYIEPSLIFLFTAFAGLVSHYMKLYLQGQTKSSIFQYFTESPNLTLLTCFGILGALGGFITSGALDHITLSALLGLGFTSGYSADSLTTPADRHMHCDNTRR